MQSFSDDGDDLFFDSHDHIQTSFDSASSADSLIENPELEFRKFEHEFWPGELLSVHERRHRFLRGMGFDELVSSKSGHSQEPKDDLCESSVEDIGLERIAQSSGAILDPLSPRSDVSHKDSVCCIRDLDSGREFIVHDRRKEGLISMLKGVGSGRLMTLQEFETFLGLSRSVQRFLRRDAAPCGEKQNMKLDAGKKKSGSWWRSLTVKRNAVGMCKYDDSIKELELPKVIRTRVRYHKKRFMEFTALYLRQKIQGHKGLIRAMKFSSSGSYLASGGVDCIVRIWQIREAESSCKCLTADDFPKLSDKGKEGIFKFGKKGYSSVIPKTLFKIEEMPLHEFHGHSSDVLDLSWSNSECLLSSSKDNTVRMWKVGCDVCLKVFHHYDYVTCIQFNPVDDSYFISGSTDGKVRMWEVTENRVVNWADVRDIVTAVCYQHDGKGFVVGSITGNCRFYDFSGNNLQLDTQLHVHGRKKSTGKRITGLQFSPEDSQRVMITSADSKIRILDGVDVIRKFRGLRKSKSQSSASFTSDGRYIVSAGEDSHVYIWNFNGSASRSAKEAKSIRSFDLFISDGVSVAVPWPGMDHGWGSLSKSSFQTSSRHEILEPSTSLRDADCSCGAWLFADGPSRGSATWPEEKLPPSEPPELVNHHHHHHHHHQCSLHHPNQCLTHLSATTNLVIVTGGCDGVIRSFHNYGLHVRN